VIMVGEIRDSETANTAIESALTGHLVFSTLHTNSASGVIPRLIDLSVNAKTIPSALSLAIAQRLVRKVCQSCKYERAATPEEINTIKKVLDTAIAKGKDISKYGITDTTAKTVWEGKGCDVCHKTGFKGRLGIFEAIQVNTSEIEKIIPTNPSDREIKEVADKQGILDMKEDGVIKVLKGITTLAEVKSVVDVEED
jgi:type IV pilus assembly protein PilB